MQKRGAYTHRMHGRAHVVNKSRKSQRSGSCSTTDGLLGFVYHHGMPGTRDRDRCGEPVRTRADHYCIRHRSTLSGSSVASESLSYYSQICTPDKHLLCEWHSRRAEILGGRRPSRRAHQEMNRGLFPTKSRQMRRQGILGCGCQRCYLLERERQAGSHGIRTFRAVVLNYTPSSRTSRRGDLR